VNLSILLTPGKENKRDSISSGERRWKRSKEKGKGVQTPAPMLLLRGGVVGGEWDEVGWKAVPERVKVS